MGYHLKKNTPCSLPQGGTETIVYNINSNNIFRKIIFF